MCRVCMQSKLKGNPSDVDGGAAGRLASGDGALLAIQPIRELCRVPCGDGWGTLMALAG